MGRPVPIRAGVGASGPMGDLLTAKLLPNAASRVAFRSPPCTPFGSPLEAIERPIGLQALFPRRSRRVRPPQGNRSAERAGGFPRGKQSARFALPCVPLVVCLNSGSLTACGGCAHWARASLRSPLHPFGESAYQWGRGYAPAGALGGFPLAPLHPFGSPPKAIARPIGLQALLPRRSRRASPAGAAPPHASRHENRAGISPCSVFMQTPLFLFLFLRPFRSLVQTVLVLPERTFRLLMNQLRVQTVITALSKASSQHEPQLHP